MSVPRPIVYIDALEFGKFEIRTILTDEYYQVYEIKSGVGSWLNNLYKVEEAMDYVTSVIRERMEAHGSSTSTAS